MFALERLPEHLEAGDAEALDALAAIISALTDEPGTIARPSLAEALHAVAVAIRAGEGDGRARTALRGALDGTPFAALVRITTEEPR